MACPLPSLVALAFLCASSQACSTRCLTCSGNPSYCLSCQPGYFSQPEAVGLCYTYCPTGYAQNSVTATCDGSPGVIVNYVLDDITSVFYDKRRHYRLLSFNL